MEKKVARKPSVSPDVEIERSSGNVFADLGLENPAECLIQAELALAIARTIREKGWTQVKAAGVLSVSQSDISNIMRGKLDGYSIERLTRLLGLLDCEVEVIVRPKQAEKKRFASL